HGLHLKRGASRYILFDIGLLRQPISSPLRSRSYGGAAIGLVLRSAEIPWRIFLFSHDNNISAASPIPRLLACDPELGKKLVQRIIPVSCAYSTRRACPGMWCR